MARQAGQVCECAERPAARGRSVQEKAKGGRKTRGAPATCEPPSQQCWKEEGESGRKALQEGHGPKPPQTPRALRHDARPPAHASSRPARGLSAAAPQAAPAARPAPGESLDGPSAGEPLSPKKRLLAAPGASGRREDTRTKCRRNKSSHRELYVPEKRSSNAEKPRPPQISDNWAEPAAADLAFENRAGPRAGRRGPRGAASPRRGPSGGWHGKWTKQNRVSPAPAEGQRHAGTGPDRRMTHGDRPGHAAAREPRGPSSAHRLGQQGPRSLRRARTLVMSSEML